MHISPLIRYAICSFTLLATTCDGLPSNDVQEKILLQSEEIDEITDRIVKIKKDADKKSDQLFSTLIVPPFLGFGALLYSYLKLQEKNRDDFQDFVVAATGSISIGSLAYWIYQISLELELIESPNTSDQSANNENETSPQQSNLYSSALFPILSTLFLVYGYLGLTGDNRDIVEKFIAISTTSFGVGLFALWIEQVAQNLKPVKPLTTTDSLALIPTFGTAALSYGYCMLREKDLDNLKRLVAGVEISLGFVSYVYWMYQIAKKLELLESCPESTKGSEENIRYWNQALLENLLKIISHI